MSNDETDLSLENSDSETTNQTATTDTSKESKDSDFHKAVEAAVQERLADMKEKMNSLDKKLKESEREKTRAEELKKQAEIKALEDAGEHTKAAERRLVEAQEKLRISEEKVTRLTRDAQLKEALREVPFRNAAAQEYAYKVLVDDLIQDSNGQWVHKSGVPIAEHVQYFFKLEENNFFIKPKQNSGAGTSTGQASDTTIKKKPSEMTSEEILKAAKEGRLGTFGL